MTEGRPCSDSEYPIDFLPEGGETRLERFPKSYYMDAGENPDLENNTKVYFVNVSIKEFKISRVWSANREEFS